MAECTTYRPQVGARETELSPAQAVALADHLAGCPGCRRFAAGLAATEGLVSEALLAAAARRDFAPFVDGVMARVEAARPRPLLSRLGRLMRLHPRLVVGGALAPLVAALALVVYVQSGTGRDLADASGLELTAEGGATTVIQSSDGPVVLLDDDDDDDT
jgi:anti-sigma factor RsiW